MNSFILTLISNFMWFTNCMPPKRKTVEPNTGISDVAKHEMAHYNDYQSNITIYETWPEVQPDNAVYACKHLFSKISSRMDLSVKFATLEKVQLRYITLETKKKKNKNSFKIFALWCIPSTPILNRKNFRFVRAPDTHCVYLLRNVSPNSNDMRIILKICDFHTYQQLRDDINSVYLPYNLSRKKSNKPAEIAKFEINHLLAFLSNQESYESWPELEKYVIMKQYCQVFLKKLFRKSQFDFNPILESLVLRYTSFTSRPPINVTALFCNASKKVRPNSQRFIRAPNHGFSTCVFLIGNMINGPQSLNLHPHYKICKKLCADEKDIIGEQEGTPLKALNIVIDEARKIFDGEFVEEIRNKLKQYFNYNHNVDIFDDLPDFQLESPSLD